MKKVIQVAGVLNWDHGFSSYTINSTGFKGFQVSRTTDVPPEIGSLVCLELGLGSTVFWRIVEAIAPSQSQQSD